MHAYMYVCMYLVASIAWTLNHKIPEAAAVQFSSVSKNWNKCAQTHAYIHTYRQYAKHNCKRNKIKLYLHTLINIHSLTRTHAHIHIHTYILIYICMYILSWIRIFVVHTKSSFVWLLWWTNYCLLLIINYLNYC